MDIGMIGIYITAMWVGLFILLIILVLLYIGIRAMIESTIYAMCGKYGTITILTIVWVWVAAIGVVCMVIGIIQSII
jgi:hypothetical protein